MLDDPLTYPKALNEAIVEKVISRRGKLYAHKLVCTEHAALVVIDLTEGYVREDPNCARIIPPINLMAQSSGKSATRIWS